MTVHYVDVVEGEVMCRRCGAYLADASPGDERFTPGLFDDNTGWDLVTPKPIWQDQLCHLNMEDP